MLNDIYIRQLNDPKYDPSKLDISDEYEMLYSKILMILSTKKGEVLGDVDFGVDIENSLFAFDLDEEVLRNDIFNQIQIYIPEASNYNLTLEISRFKGTVRDIVLLDFKVDGRKQFGLMIK